MVITAATALLASSLSISAQAQGPEVPDNAVQGGKSLPKATSKPREVGKKDRAAVLGDNHSSSKDVALSTSGDGTGFHVLTGREKDGYKFTTVATLREDGFDADSWIGNACVTGSGKYAAIAYAPRTFTNKPELMVRGAFTAVVDLGSGKVTKLPFTASLAYFSPGCGTGNDAVFTQLTHDGDKAQKTRLITVNAATGRQSKPVAFPGQVTSAVPTRHGIVAGHGNRLVRINGRTETVLAVTKHVPFQIAADSGGGVTFIDRETDSKKTRARSWAKRLNATQVKGKKTTPKTVAEGKLTDWDLSATPGGTVFLTGKAKNTGTLPGPVRNPGHLAKGARISSLGHVGVSTSWADGKTSLIAPEDAKHVRDARITLDVVATGKRTELDATPQLSAKRAEAGSRLSPALGLPTGKKSSAEPSVSGDSDGLSAQTMRTQALTASATGPSEGTDERYCAVARNDVKKQAFQPTPRQVEWAVDQAVVGELNFYRSPNWKNTGMGGYQPQGLFPPIVLAGDPNGTLDNEDPDVTDRWHIPSQVMLGVTAQESNMWQATRFAVPGVTANSLVGNYYGTQYTSDGTQADPWRINFSEADCGYGITQATDGMRLAGKEKDGETALSPLTQDAVALDYTANIAYGVQILSDKWNQTYRAGMKVNDGHPKWIENWFFALWAYNSGFYETADSAGHKGLGWTNNPANPLWKANRVPFLQHATDPSKDDYSHAAHPQDWPYEEKVLGWAARPISAMFAPGDFKPGYLAAWWNSNASRSTVKPPIDRFCDASNDCVPSKIGDNDSNDPGMGACQLDAGDSDTNPHWLHCWWDKSAQWKDCDRLAECGNQVHRFNTSYPEQPDANSYPPRCSSGLPSNALIVDDVPGGTTPAGSGSRGCGAVQSDGTFTLTYQPSDIIDADTGQTITTYPGKIDTHQIGAGYGNHFWFTHTRSPESFPEPGDRMKVTGTWKLGQKITEQNGQAKVYAFVPDHGAQTTAANYKIKTAFGTVTKKISQTDNSSNKWVDLGAYRFNDTIPEVSLDNFNGGSGDADIAFDAIAFVPGDYSGMPQVALPAPNPNAPTPADKEPIEDKSPGVPSWSPVSTTFDTFGVAPNHVLWCTNQDFGLAGPAKVYVTRTQGCVKGQFGFVKKVNGATVGTATFDYQMEIALNKSSEVFESSIKIVPRTFTGESFAEPVSLLINGSCTVGCTASGRVNKGTPTWDYAAGDTHLVSVDLDHAWDKSRDYDSFGISWNIEMSSGGTPAQNPAIFGTTSSSRVRCDKIAYGTTIGCVFHEYTPTYVMNSSKFPEAAAHIWLVQNKLNRHFGDKNAGVPLTYLGKKLANDGTGKLQKDRNRTKICETKWTTYPGTALHTDLWGKTDTISCDEFAFANSYESGGTPASNGGPNPVDDGSQCVQTYIADNGDNTYSLKLRPDAPLPTWQEPCGRSSMSNWQNTQSMQRFGGVFVRNNRLIQDDEYWIDLDGFTP